MEKKLIIDIYMGALDDVLGSFLKDKAFYALLKGYYESIIHIAQKNNITVIIIKEPAWLNNRGMIFDVKFKPVWDKMYNMLDEVGREYNVKVLEIDIPKNDEYFMDGAHLTPKGNEYLADTIYKKLFKK